MKLQNLKLNFFLPNYYPGKNNSAKFILNMTKKSKFNDERSTGSHTIDPNIYIEELKKKGKNNFAEIWTLSDEYCV